MHFSRSTFGDLCSGLWESNLGPNFENSLVGVELLLQVKEPAVTLATLHGWRFDLIPSILLLSCDADLPKPSISPDP